MTSNPADILLLYEEKLNKKATELPHIDWATFPTLDCLVFSALQWGHSYRDQQWGQVAGDQQEYKIQVTERLLVTSNEHYLLDPNDTDSHSPLMVKVEPAVASEHEKREFKTMEGVHKRAVARKERQKANKAKGKAKAAR